MKFMEFKHKDIYVKTHTSIIVTREVNEKDRKQQNELVYANVIDIDSRVQAMFAQFHHSRKKSDVFFRISHAPRIGEKDYDKSSLYVYPSGKYKHMSLREDDTFVTGLVVSEKVLERQKMAISYSHGMGTFMRSFFGPLIRIMRHHCLKSGHLISMSS